MTEQVLLVKTSSLGDVVHALPAVTEAVRKTDVQFTWVVEEGLVDIPNAHPAVGEVIPVAIRRWRSNWIESTAEIRSFVAHLRERSFDRVIDSQGLIKSAIISLLAKGGSFGFDRLSAREPLAASFYGSPINVPAREHAIIRQKQLLANVLGYEMDETIDYGLETAGGDSDQTIFLFHGTTWRSKEWPVANWQALVNLIREGGYDPVLPSGSTEELARAGQIMGSGVGKILDRLPLSELMSAMSRAAGSVSVDTGLGHLAPALGIPSVGLFGATLPDLTGMRGLHSEVIVSDHLPCIPCRKRDCQYPLDDDSSRLYPPCFDQTTPEKVWQALQRQIGSKDTRPD